MHHIEPFYFWRDDYIACHDKKSPFYKTSYSEFLFDKQLYNYCIHPQWDYFGSNTLYIKILFVDYDQGYSIIELLGEWNDVLHNDIMFLKREIFDLMIKEGINKYILIGENVLNFHSSDDCYYEELFQDIEEGWIVGMNFKNHVIDEFKQKNIDYYIHFSGQFNQMIWRKMKPIQLFNQVMEIIYKRLK